MVASDLERRFRRLLWWYPRDYRLRRGDELVSTLLDLAPPAQTRPSRRDVVELVRGGLRQRFRLPLGRSAVLAALLMSAMFAALGAGAGSWVGWRGAAALPADAVLHEVAGGASGRSAQPRVERHDGAFERFPSVSTHDPVPVDGWSPDAARSRLAALGWQTEWTGAGLFTATRDGLRLRVSATTLDTGSLVMVVVWSQQPGAVTPLTVAGLVLGALAGWLCTAWAAYRLRRLPGAARSAALVLAGAGALALAGPTIGTGLLVARLVLPADIAYSPLPVFSDYVFRDGPSLALAGLAALAGALALIAAAADRFRSPRTALCATVVPG
jgi:hypothetical protein